MIYLILFIAVVLRFVLINQSLWLDESLEALALMGRMGPILKYSLTDFQPPLYHFILLGWTRLAGYSELALRTPSVIAGVGTVIYGALIAKTLSGKKAMYLVAILLATNPLLIYYSQEGRTYGLTAFLVTAAFYYLLKTHTNNSPKQLILYFVFSTLFLWTSYLSWLLHFSLFVYFLYKKNYRVVAVQALSAATLLLWLPSLFSSLGIGLSTINTSPVWGKVVGGLTLSSLPLTWFKFAVGRISFANHSLYILVAAIVFILHAAALTRISKLRDLKLLWLWFFAPIALGSLVALMVPVYQYFRLLFVLPAYLILLGLSLKQSRWLAFAIISIQVLALCVFWLNPSFHREDWRGLVADFGTSSQYLLPSLNQNAPLLYYGVARSNIESSTTKPSGSTLVYIRYAEPIFDPNHQGPASLTSSGYTITSSRVYSGLQVDIYENHH